METPNILNISVIINFVHLVLKFKNIASLQVVCKHAPHRPSQSFTDWVNHTTCIDSRLHQYTKNWEKSVVCSQGNWRQIKKPWLEMKTGILFSVIWLFIHWLCFKLDLTLSGAMCVTLKSFHFVFLTYNKQLLACRLIGWVVFLSI